jgi:hypothetical protein
MKTEKFLPQEIYLFICLYIFYLSPPSSGFGGAEVACWPLIPKFKPGRSRRIFKGRKNPQRAFLLKGSKIIGPMSQNCGMLKNPGYISQASSGRHFRP